MRRLLAIMMAAFATGIALSAPVKSLVGARSTSVVPSEGGGTIPATAYVQDGLVAIWDSIDNAGWGVHSSSLIGIRELISGRVIAAEEIGDNYARFEKNIGYNISYGPRPSAVTIEFVGCFTGTGWGKNGNPMFNSIWSLQYNSYGSYAGRAFSSSSSWVSSGWKDWHDSLVSDSVIRLSCDGTTTTLSVGDGTSSRSFAGGFGNITKINFCTQGKDASSPDIFHCARVYNRVLTAEEIAHNYAVDYARFLAQDEDEEEEE